VEYTPEPIQRLRRMPEKRLGHKEYLTNHHPEQVPIGCSIGTCLSADIDPPSLPELP
jgi:hypothetical protein